MIYLNTLLREAGIEPERARLVRHQDSDVVTGRSVHDLWQLDASTFEAYQRIQARERFKDSSHIISFVVTPWTETLFVGVYRVNGVATVPAGTIEPLTGQDVSGQVLYDLTLDDALRDYAGRIVVDWGSGVRTWVQHAEHQNKPVREIRQKAMELPFPGMAAFTWRLRELPSVPRSWQEVLSSLPGIYLLVSTTNGQQYVGSAYGQGGFWSRWSAYARNGHGGNVAMREVPDDDYQVTILETVSSSLDLDGIVALESQWKDKLLSRKFGRNRN